MNQVAQIQEQAIQCWANANPTFAAKGIDEAMWAALSGSVFPGAKPESVLMAVDYCRANNLDILQKPVHLVPMYVKDAATQRGAMRDVVMPGIGMYRIQASRTGDYAGSDAPTFGPVVSGVFTNKAGESVEVNFPEWCSYTVYKLIDGVRVPFTATEYWEENYATDSRNSTAPNAMWAKRVRGQIVKCAEAQALRRAWPEIGQIPTAEEMEGKTFDYQSATEIKEMGSAEVVEPETYPAADFKANFPKWEKLIVENRKSASDVIATVEAKAPLTEEQKTQILNVGSEVA